MQQPSPVVLIVNGNKVEYAQTSEVEEYLYAQEQNWKWLNKLPDHYRENGTALYMEYFFNRISSIREELASGAKRVKLGSEKMPYTSFDSDEGYLILKTKDEYGAVTAALTLLFMNKYTRGTMYRDGRVREFAEDPKLVFERSVAIQIGLSLQEFSALVADARSSVVRQTVERFVSHAELATDAVNQYVIEIADKTESLEARADRVVNSITAAYHKRKKNYINFASKSRLAAKNAVEEVKTTLASAKSAYHDQVDLDASVQYWSVRKTNHSKYKIYWFLAIVLSMILTFGSVVSYYGLGGASGVPELFGQMSPEGEHATASANVEQKILAGKSRSELASAVADLAGAALLITLLGILIRISLRQFNTHSHLALEAEERITFTKTYLALLNEGKLKSEEDRRLVLESLFRTTKSGGADEISFASPVELILKTISDKKP
ncbi:DUF6161 domain-containing protein [Pseudomonas sp. EA_15y_Pfl1_P102]|uniref:DUF6161 domain-containing protein n=1 Tax=Pseudomonas sp. EA_15y_Pfl1_P102 TaxID=3088685 RepID=UPI0030D72873